MSRAEAGMSRRSTVSSWAAASLCPAVRLHIMLNPRRSIIHAYGSRPPRSPLCHPCRPCQAPICDLNEASDRLALVFTLPTDSVSHTKIDPKSMLHSPPRTLMHFNPRSAAVRCGLGRLDAGLPSGTAVVHYLAATIKLSLAFARGRAARLDCILITTPVDLVHAVPLAGSTSTPPEAVSRLGPFSRAHPPTRHSAPQVHPRSRVSSCWSAT